MMTDLRSQIECLVRIEESCSVSTPLRVIDVMTSDVLEAIKGNEVAEVDCEPSSSEIRPIETEIPEFLR